MTSNDFVNADYLIRDVSVRVDDPEFRKGLTRGWYMTQIRDALDELAYETFFDTITADFDFNATTYQMEMPKGCFNIKEIYMWNGDCCMPSNSKPVYWKRQFRNQPGGAFYTAARTDNNTVTTFDPFFPNDYIFGWNKSNLLWANIQNGLIMFSSTCAGYPKVRLVYNGTGGDIGEDPIIPRFFAIAVKDFIAWRFFEAMAAREPRIYATMMDRAYAKLYDNKTGTMWEAKDRITLMHDWERESMKMYMERGNW